MSSAPAPLSPLPHPLPPAPSAATPDHAARLALAKDAPAIGAWLQATQPLDVLARRAREAALAGLLSHPERGVCILAESGGHIAGLLVASIVPSVGHAGLTALATEWHGAPCVVEAGTPRQALAPCLQALSDWCMAHGVRHLRLTPGLHAAAMQEDAALGARFARGADGLWHETVSPAPKQLA